MSKLKPCPFCGSLPELNKYYDQYRLYHVSKRCIVGYIDIIYRTKEAAIKDWNYRYKVNDNNKLNTAIKPANKGTK